MIYKVKYVFSSWTLMRNWNSSLSKTLIHFGLQTLKMNEYNPFNPFTLFFCMLLQKIELNMTILLWRLWKTVIICFIIRQFYNCHILYVKYGIYKRYYTLIIDFSRGHRFPCGAIFPSYLFTSFFIIDFFYSPLIYLLFFILCLSNL